MSAPFPLRQATASQEIPLGPFLDSVDGNTQKTALTINNTDIKIWKTGATSRVSKNSGGATHMDAGVYYTVLDATDTDTIGPMRVTVHVTGALYVQLDCVVFAAHIYDALIAGTHYFEAHPGKFAPSGANVLLYARDGTTVQRTATATTDANAAPYTSLG